MLKYFTVLEQEWICAKYRGAIFFCSWSWVIVIHVNNVFLFVTCHLSSVTLFFRWIRVTVFYVLCALGAKKKFPSKLFVNSKCFVIFFFLSLKSFSRKISIIREIDFKTKSCLESSSSLLSFLSFTFQSLQIKIIFCPSSASSTVSLERQPWASASSAKRCPGGA